MTHVYHEYCFKKDVTIMNILLECMLIASGVAFLFYSLFVPILVPIMFVMFFLAYFYHRSLKLEYEYTLIDDDFSIDKIIAKMKRKKMAFFNLVDLVDITVEGDAFEQKYGSLKHKTKRFVSKCHDDPEYVLVLRRGGRYTYVHIQADEQLLKALKTRHVTVFHVDGI